MRLQDGDEVVSMSVLNTYPFTVEEREAYLRAVAKRDEAEGEGAGEGAGSGEPLSDAASVEGLVLSVDKLEEMQENEQFLLSVSDLGFGKRTSAYAYRCSGRGGQGVSTMNLSDLTGGVVCVFPVAEKDEILLLTNRGQLLRCPVNRIRMAGRCTRGVRVFRLEEEEAVVSVALLPYTPEISEGDDDAPIPQDEA